MKLTAEQEAKLLAPLHPSAVTKHPTKTYLSSIKAIYVTERLNQVFGIGGWSTKVEHVANGDKGMVVVKLILTVPEYGIYYESFGGNDNGGEGSKNFDLGDAYKGATTDALTKIGSFLGIGIEVFKGNGNSQSQPNNTTPKTPQNPITNQPVFKPLTAEQQKQLNDLIMLFDLRAERIEETTAKAIQGVIERKDSTRFEKTLTYLNSI